MVSIVAPYPDFNVWTDGYSIRIDAIDKMFFSEEKRIYINVNEDLKDAFPKRILISDLVTHLIINPNKVIHKLVAYYYFSRSKLIYFHSVYQVLKLRFAFMINSKTLVDLHGIAPEEQRMIGDTKLSNYLSKCDEFVTKHADYLIAVTNAMGNYYKKKYDFIKAKIFILPIFNLKPSPKSLDKIRKRSKRLIYCGSSQKWQRAEKMVEALKRIQGYDSFTILTADIKEFKELLEKFKINNYKLLTAPSSDLKKYYHNNDYGFVLRNNDVVNTVSCPTKLIEYMCYGVLPIVDNVNLGDFNELKYSYIKLEDFEQNKYPTLSQYQKKLENNYKIIGQMIKQVEKTKSEIKLLV